MTAVIYCISAWFGIFITDFIVSVYPTRICSYRTILKNSFIVSSIILLMFIFSTVVVFYASAVVADWFL